MLDRIFTEHEIDGVVHLAGFKYAGVSVSRPLHTYTQNVSGMIALLAAMAEHGVARFVFSSSAAVYGTPESGLVTEATPTRPESPYGESKLVGEWLLADQARATESTAQPLRHTSLRYFNVVGSGYPDLRDTSPHNLFPLIFDALVAGRVPHINGDDYPTPDGTCVRDYVHVSDLALAHVAAAQALMSGAPWNRSTTWAAGPACRSARSWTRWPGSPGSPSPPRYAGAAPATRPRSWPPASSPPGTWTGGCGTPWTRWSPRPGPPAKKPRRA